MIPALTAFFFIAVPVAADSVLIPAADISAQDYFSHCGSPEYICTTDLFFGEILKEPTPLFDRLLDRLDRSSSSYRRMFRQQVPHILLTEMLDLTQLNLLLRLLHEFPETRSMNLTRQLSGMRTSLQRLPDTDTTLKDGFAVLFRKKVPLQSVDTWRNESVPVLLYLVSYNQLPLKTSLIENSKRTSVPLLQAVCPRIQSNLNSVTPQVYLRKPCASAIPAATARKHRTEHPFYRSARF